MKIIRITLFAILALMYSSSFAFSQIYTANQDDEFKIQLDKFYSVIKTAKDFYVEDINTTELVTAAIKASLGKLDPHSIYLPPKKLKSENEKFKGSFDGIGVQFSVIDDTINIISPIAGGPSEKLGIFAGDKIVKIEHNSAIGLSNDSIQSLLRGRKGTKVNVDIFRVGTPELLSFEITRDKIPLYSVDASFIIDGTDIGYISINRFMRTTHEEMLDSLQELSANGMKKLILDLRGNPGGYLNQAFLVADEFIPKGHTIVFTKGRKPQFDETYYSRSGGKYEQIPLIVLVDAGSASASEIVSGSLQDLDRGLIVGLNTYGKGLVQRQYNLPDGSGFRITIARYYTPSGRCIQRSYKDKKKYRNMSDWLDLKEGMNINHALEEVKVEKKLDSLPPIYKTSGGRNVLGGGGITPDYIVKYDTITKLSRKIRSKNLFYIYVRNYLDGARNNLLSKYKNNFHSYLKDYKVSDKMIDDFKKLAESKKIKWDDKQFKQDKKYITTLIKSTIARSIWGNNESTEIFMPIIRQAMKAITLFPEAEKLSNLK